MSFTYFRFFLRNNTIFPRGWFYVLGVFVCVGCWCWMTQRAKKGCRDPVSLEPVGWCRFPLALSSFGSVKNTSNGKSSTSDVSYWLLSVRGSLNCIWNTWMPLFSWQGREVMAPLFAICSPRAPLSAIKKKEKWRMCDLEKRAWLFCHFLPCKYILTCTCRAILI